MAALGSRGVHLTVALFLLLCSWEGFVQAFDPLQRLFPGPWKTILIWFSEIRVWGPQAYATGRTLAFAIVGASTLAIPLAFGMVRFRIIRAGIEALFLVLQCLPLFVFTPVLVALIGWGWMTVLLPSMLVVVFPLCMSLFKAIERVPKPYLDLFATYQVSAWRLFWHLQLPYALPAFFSGLRVAIATLGTTVLAAEFAGGQEGLGMLIQESRRNFDLATAFASILTLTLLMAGLIVMSSLLERIALRGRSCATVA